MIKVEYRKTRRNRIQREVRQIYLHSDLPCGLAGCSSCDQVGQLTPGPLYLLDQETYDKQLDLVSHMHSLKNVVVLQSQLENVAQSGRQEYFSNLRQLVETEDGSTSYFIYPDLLSQHIHDKLQHYSGGTSPQDEQARRLIETAIWYQHHINTHGMAFEVRLAVSSVSVLRLIQTHNQEQPQNSLQCILIYQLVQQTGDQSLLDFMGYDTAIQEELPQEQEHQNVYDPHWEQSQLREGLRKGELVKGVMRIRDECDSGMVTMWLQGVMVQISVQGKTMVNRSINGDQVAVLLDPLQKWARADGVPLQADEEDLDQRHQDQAQLEEGLGSLLKSGDYLPSGQVVGILQRNKTRFCGQVVQQEHIHVFMPSDQRYPELQVRAGLGTRLDNMKVQVELEEWPAYSTRGHAHVRRIIGPSGDSRTEGEVILLEHNVDNREFSKKVLQCLPQEGNQFTIKPEEIALRTDLRHITVMSVDPPGCKDIDDALHCRWVDQAQGIVECGVHIADVSHFVKANSPLDLEAQSRCTTVYLVDRRTDMLPKLLTENLCSLRSGVDRLAFTVLWTVHLPTGHIKDTKYAKTVIRSRQAFTYEQAQNIIDNEQDHSEEAQGLRMLNHLAKIFKSARNEQGALSLASMQVKFKFDQDNTHDPTDVGFYSLFDTNSMVEEFMLLANQAVATQTLRHFPCNAILRRHSPPKEAIKQFSQVLHQLGYSLDYSSSKALQHSLDTISIQCHSSDPFLSQLLRIITTRYMNEAQYFCSNDYSFPEYVHYGLAMSLYTHFTSPIRRYADVLVHRLLASSLDIQSLDPTLANTQKLKKICAQMNFKNRMARYAGRASSDYHTFLFFKNRSVTDSGLVSSISLAGFNVVLPKYGLEGLIKFTEQQQHDNLVHFRQQNQSITSFIIAGHQIQLFQRIQVKVKVELKFFHKNIQLEFIGPQA